MRGDIQSKKLQELLVLAPPAGKGSAPKGFWKFLGLAPYISEGSILVFLFANSSIVALEIRGKAPT